MLNQYIEKFNQDGQIYLRIKVRPDASTTEVRQFLKDEDGDIIKIDISAPAVQGRANQDLINFLAAEFKVSKKNISIISGTGDRLKLVKLMK